MTNRPPTAATSLGQGRRSLRVRRSLAGAVLASTVCLAPAAYAQQYIDPNGAPAAPTNQGTPAPGGGSFLGPSLYGAPGASLGYGVAPTQGTPAPEGYPTTGQPGAMTPGTNGGGLNAGTGGSASSQPTGFFVGYGPVLMPEFYTIARGDTLWDISTTFFANPWYWPRLWSYNPMITNPHWIYPGQVLRLIPARPSAPGQGAAQLYSPPPSQPLTITENAFIDEKTFTSSSVIVGSEADKRLLATSDIAYVQTTTQSPLVAGTSYPIYRVDSEVHDPDTGALLGYLALVIGQDDIDSVNDQHIARGTLTSTDAIERGDHVSPLPHEFQAPTPQSDDRDLEARVVADLQLRKLAGASQIVVVNRGSADGVQVGNRLFVYRQGDQYIQGMGADDRTMRVPLNPDYPKEDRATLLIVDLQPHTAVALVIASTKEVDIGDYAEMRKGF